MKTFLLVLVLIASSVNAEVLFREANALEKSEIYNTMAVFYADQLLRAGLFESETEAREAALLEMELEQLKDDTHVFCILSSEDNKIQYGYLIYYFIPEEQDAYLDLIYLEEKYQGQGFGTQVFHRLEKLLLENGIDVLRLYVFDHNKRAMGLYNKVGYEIETPYYTNGQLTGYYMKKDLKNSSNS